MDGNILIDNNLMKYFETEGQHKDLFFLFGHTLNLLNIISKIV